MLKRLKEHVGPFIGTCFVAGIILTILAPYGTHGMSLLPRAVFWIGLCAAGGIGAASVAYICHRRGVELGPAAMTLWQSLGATILVSVFMIGLNYSVAGRAAFIDIVVVVFYVWVIAVTLSGIGNLLRKTQSGVPAVPTRAVLYERLKPHLRSADIYALSAEDHYVRVHTSNGDDLILMRLSDAMRDVASIEGLSPHRSWWVAEKGVRSVTRKDGKTTILLHNDVSVPVSRNQQKEVKDAGWL